eukprot:scaffold98214_cov31-Tisochrysis_lutea.AAC.1
MPPKPVDFGRFIKPEVAASISGGAAGERNDFEQISTARLDPRFAGNDVSSSQPLAPSEPDSFEHFDIIPEGGTLVLFDSVSLPHQPLVKELYRRLKLYDREHVEAILATRFLLATQGREVLPVTAKRPRIAATGWFHEDSQLFIPPFPKQTA